MSATKSSIPRPPDEFLSALYVNLQLGCPEIGKLFDRDGTTVHNWLVSAGIPTRKRGSYKAVQFKPGAPSAFAGRTHTAEARRKIGAASVDRAWPHGDAHWLRNVPPEGNPNWKGGATPERQEFYRSSEWKAACRAVWARDDACCRRCQLDWRTVDRKTTPTFHVHHVLSFQIRETRANPALLVLLCRTCHLFVHSNANVTREWLPQEPGADFGPRLADLDSLPPFDVDKWIASEIRGRIAFAGRKQVASSNGLAMQSTEVIES